MRGRYRATLIGCALGDALGMPVEGWRPEQIEKYVGKITNLISPVVVKETDGSIKHDDEYGKIKYHTKDLLKGEYTDDTILTLAIAESIADNRRIDIEDILKRQYLAYKQRLQPDGKARGGFGGSTIKAFQNYEQGIEPTGVKGSGNGPPMKMSPVGLYMDATGEYEYGLEQARKISAATHLDPRSITAGVIQAHAVFVLLQNCSKEEFIESIEECCTKYEGTLSTEFLSWKEGSLLSKISWIRRNSDAKPKQAYRQLGNSSYAFESFPFSLFMFTRYWDEPVKGLIETVNFGGDCDTTGAIYGALTGARNGMTFPKSWLEEARGLKELMIAADRIYSIKEI